MVERLIIRDGLMEKKYVLSPGYIESQSDGDIHYINATTLASLYGVDMRECYVQYRDRRYHSEKQERAKLIWLFPRRSGDYSVESCSSFEY